MSHPILVTGAAGGTQGSTGRLVASLLLEQGLPVRALVHRFDSFRAHHFSITYRVSLDSFLQVCRKVCRKCALAGRDYAPAGGPGVRSILVFHRLHR